jgi:hypothetical protein
VTRRALAAVVVASLVAGVALMLAFDSGVTRAVGVACLLFFVAGGLWLIAAPDFLARDE